MSLLRIPIIDYVRDPAPAPSLSASLAHTLLTRSPRHAWVHSPRLNPAWAPEESEAMDIGTIAHAILLEGDRSRIEVIDAEDWRTKAARSARDLARLAGKIPVLAERMTTVEAMVSAAREAIAKSELAGVFADGEPELTLIWQEGGTWCRSRPDWLSRDRRLIVDFKTTAVSGEPSAWARGPLLSMGYDLQAALALRGVMAVECPRDCVFVFMIQEVAPPYAISLVGLSPAFASFADRKIGAAIALWTECLATNRWPAYPLRTCWAELPAWAETRWFEREVLGGSATSAPMVVDDGRPIAEQLMGAERGR